MIILLITLLSLSAIYYSRLLFRKEMKIASLMVGILYLYLFVWIYAILIVDLADLGFLENETRISILHGSDIYHSFVKMNGMMSVIPLSILKAIVAVATLTLVAGFIVVFHGLFEFTVEFVKAIKSKKAYHTTKPIKSKTSSALSALSNIQIIRMYCRMNC